MKRAYKEDKMFKAFKKKLQHESMIKSIIYGVIGRLFSSAILIAMCKFLNRIYLLKYLTAPVAILSLLLVTIGNYILTKPSAKSIAKRLDNDLHLQEKLSTMIEFNDMDGIIIDKQHEDAIDALNKQQEIAKNLLQVKPEIPLEVIAQTTGLSLEELEKIKSSI